MVLGKKLGVEGSLGLHGAVRGLVLMARVCLSLFLGVGLSSFALWVGVTPLVSGFSGLALPCASEEGCSGTSCLATLVAKTKRNKKLMLNKEKKNHSSSSRTSINSSSQASLRKHVGLVRPCTLETLQITSKFFLAVMLAAENAASLDEIAVRSSTGRKKNVIHLFSLC